MRIGPQPPAVPPTRAAATTFDPGNPADVDALARRYAPIRYLHPKEQYGPSDPGRFIQSSRVREHRSWRPDKTPDGFDYGQIDPAKLPGLKGDNLYLDLRDTESARRGEPHAPSFYQYDPKTRTMTHWYFYAYNDAPGPIAANHEGDWERITIQLDDNLQPTHVRYSSHGGQVTVPWDQAPKEHGRPVVYVGLGSHANSPSTARTPTKVPGIEDQYGRGQRIDGAAEPLRNILREPWYDTQVHWGERGKLAVIGQSFTSGPKGPGAGKGPLK